MVYSMLVADKSYRTPAGVMELVDVVDSKSTDGDIVPVRVRPPAPKYGIPQWGIPYFYAVSDKLERSSSLGSEATAAGGGVKGAERVAVIGERGRRSVADESAEYHNRNTGTLLFPPQNNTPCNFRHYVLYYVLIG